MMSSAPAGGSTMGGEAGSAGEWTWEDARGPRKSIPLRAITLRLSPSVLHRFDIGDLRAAGRRAAQRSNQTAQVTGDHQPSSSSATTNSAVPTEFIDPRLLVLSAPQPVVPLGGEPLGAGEHMISPVPGAAWDALFAENDALSSTQPSTTTNSLPAQPIEQPFTLYQPINFSTNDIDRMSSSTNTNNLFPAIPTDYFERAPTPDFTQPWVYAPDGARLLPGTILSPPETLHIPRQFTPPQSLYANHQQQYYHDNSVVPRQDLLHNNHQQYYQNSTFLPRPDTLRQDQLYSDHQQRQQLAAIAFSPPPYYQSNTVPPRQDTLRQDQSYSNHRHQYHQSEAFPLHQNTLRQDTLRQDSLNDNNQLNHHPNTASMRDFPTPFEYLLDPYVDVTHNRAVLRDRRQQEYDNANTNRRPPVVVPDLDPNITAPLTVSRTSIDSSNNSITRMVLVDEYNHLALSYSAIEESVMLERQPQIDRGRRRQMAIDEIVWDNMAFGMNYAAYQRKEDARYKRCCNQGLAQACVTEKQARDRSRGRYVEIHTDGERGAYQLLSTGSGGSGSNGDGVNGIVVRHVNNRDIRREGVWDADRQKYRVGRGVGEHWKTVQQWKEVLRSGGIGFDEAARWELGIDTLQPGQLSEREIKQLLADKIGDVEDGPDVELNGLFGVGTFRDIGQYDVRPPPCPTGQTSMGYSTTTGETEGEPGTLDTDMNSGGDVDMEL